MLKNVLVLLETYEELVEIFWVSSPDKLFVLQIVHVISLKVSTISMIMFTFVQDGQHFISVVCKFLCLNRTQ